MITCLTANQGQMPVDWQVEQLNQSLVSISGENGCTSSLRRTFFVSIQASKLILDIIIQPRTRQNVGVGGEQTEHVSVVSSASASLRPAVAPLHARWPKTMRRRGRSPTRRRRRRPTMRTPESRREGHA